jgi:serine O-acetyltransferase
MIELLKIIKDDLNSKGNTNIVRLFLKFFFNMSFRLVLNYRIGHYLSNNRGIVNNLLIMWLKKRQLKRYACDISYQAKLGKGISFPHPLGIVIGVGVVVKNNVMIWQHVTLGSGGHDDKSYPIIEDNVKLFSHIQVLGGIQVSSNAKVGASSLVLQNVPKNKTAVGIPAKIL